MNLYYEFLQNFTAFILPFLALDVVLFLLINPYLDRIISILESTPPNIITNTQLGLINIRKRNFVLGTFLSLTCSFFLNVFFFTICFFLFSFIGIELSSILTIIYIVIILLYILCIFSIFHFIKFIKIKNYE